MFCPQLLNEEIAKNAAQLAAGYEISGYTECRALLNPVKSTQESPENCHQRVPQTPKHCLMETNMKDLFQEAYSWDMSHRASACISINAMAAFCNHHGYWVENMHCGEHRQNGTLGLVVWHLRASSAGTADKGKRSTLNE
ncbi:hypothetical protein V5799_031124 [Amblyomma americanum]|uniref:Uncharacterized protein n=1 Tax=Amblyomma americanum TaxID=6943 RepID=A0AAQ4ELP1_AMBAM